MHYRISVSRKFHGVDLNNGRLDLWVQSISNLASATINARWPLLAIFELAWAQSPRLGLAPKRAAVPKNAHLSSGEIERSGATSENPFANLVITLSSIPEWGPELCAWTSSVDLDDFSATVREGKGGKDRLVLFTEATVMRLMPTTKFER